MTNYHLPIDQLARLPVLPRAAPVSPAEAAAAAAAGGAARCAALEAWTAGAARELRCAPRAGRCPPGTAAALAGCCCSYREPGR